MSTSIILIGPSGAGKTTLAPMLAARLGWTPVELDRLRWRYFEEIGYSQDYADRLRQAYGLPALERYWKPYDIHALERVLSDYPDGHVIALGAGHSYYDDPAQFVRARRALAPFRYVIYLLPTADVEESVGILRARIAARDPHLSDLSLDRIAGLNRAFMSHPSNGLLATHTINTDGMTPDELCDAAEMLVR